VYKAVNEFLMRFVVCCCCFSCCVCCCCSTRSLHIYRFN